MGGIKFNKANLLALYSSYKDYKSGIFIVVKYGSL